MQTEKAWKSVTSRFPMVQEKVNVIIYKTNVQISAIY